MDLTEERKFHIEESDGRFLVDLEEKLTFEVLQFMATSDVRHITTKDKLREATQNSISKTDESNAKILSAMEAENATTREALKKDYKTTLQTMNPVISAEDLERRSARFYQSCLERDTKKLEELRAGDAENLRAVRDSRERLIDHFSSQYFLGMTQTIEKLARRDSKTLRSITRGNAISLLRMSQASPPDMTVDDHLEMKAEAIRVGLSKMAGKKYLIMSCVDSLFEDAVVTIETLKTIHDE